MCSVLKQLIVFLKLSMNEFLFKMSFQIAKMLLVAVFFLIIQYSISGFVNSQNAGSATEDTCDCKKLLIGRFQSQNLSVDCGWMLLGYTF